MEIFNKELFIGIGVIIILYTLFRLMSKPDEEFDKELDDVLNSDKYKVKGQYE